MKNRMMKYMKLKNTDNWAKIMSPVFDAYNNSPHSATKIAPNKVNKDNEIQVLKNIDKRAKKGTYPVLNLGDDVRVPVIHKQHTKDIKIASGDWSSDVCFPIYKWCMT